MLKILNYSTFLERDVVRDSFHAKFYTESVFILYSSLIESIFIFYSSLIDGSAAAMNNNNHRKLSRVSSCANQRRGGDYTSPANSSGQWRSHANNPLAQKGSASDWMVRTPGKMNSTSNNTDTSCILQYT